MKITLETRGGLAALRRAAVVLDDTSLSPAAVGEARALVSAAERAAARPPRERSPLPDAQSYVVQVDDGGRTLSLTGSDLRSDPEFAALHEWILQHARTRS